MSVNAYAAYEPKGGLKPFKYDSGDIGPHDVEIKITHCGICHSDIHLIDNDWGISAYPLVPGHEIIGSIVAAGSEVQGMKIGQRVGVGWQSGSCMRCRWCQCGQENLCNDSKPTCVGRHGGFADFMRTDSAFAFPIPDKMNSETAAPLLCAGITVYSPMKHYALKPAQKVGIIGIGGLGHIALQFARAMGCEVTAFSSSRSKEEEAKAFGAHHFVSSQEKKAMRASAGSLDFILSTVTAPLDWISFINILNKNGRLCFVGGTVGNLEFPAGMLVMGQKSVCGSVIGGRATINEMLDFAARHDIRAKTEALPLEGVNKAIEKIRKNEARYRMVLKN